MRINKYFPLIILITLQLEASGCLGYSKEISPFSNTVRWGTKHINTRHGEVRNHLTLFCDKLINNNVLQLHFSKTQSDLPVNTLALLYSLAVNSIVKQGGNPHGIPCDEVITMRFSEENEEDNDHQEKSLVLLYSILFEIPVSLGNTRFCSYYIEFVQPKNALFIVLGKLIV